MANHERSRMKHPLLLLSGLLCDETVWADIPERLGDAADVRIISFRGFSSIPAMAEHVFAMIERSTPDSYAGQINALLNRPEALSVLPTIGVPTLLLSGSEDTWSPVSQHETMRRRIPHATLFEVHGAGHMAPIERPDAVSLALRQWLEEI